jgi:flagellin FlaB
MIRNTVRFMKNLHNEEVGSPMVKSAVRLVKRFGKEEAGITALETAIILIAFVVVASVFAFTMLSAGTFSTERGKETIYAGLNEVKSSMEVKGGVIAVAEPSVAGVSGTVTSLVFTLGNVLEGEPINLNTGADAEIVMEYRDAAQRVAIPNDEWSVVWLGTNNGNGLLEGGELAEITVDLAAANLNPELQVNTTFVLEVKPPSGAVLNFQRTTPAWLDAINDLQ